MVIQYTVDSGPLMQLSNNKEFAGNVYSLLMLHIVYKYTSPL